jgi:hypothetical protein
MKILKCECSVKIFAKEMCWYCYRRKYDATHKRPIKKCKICNQDKEYQGKGMCQDCYSLWYSRREDIKERRRIRNKKAEKILERRLY